MIQLTTHGSGEPFLVRGDTKGGTQIFDDGLNGYFHVPGASYRELLREFAGKEVTPDDLRRWLATNVGFKQDLSAQVAAILLAEGLAELSNDKIAFPGGD